jgi:hypothetical protein
MCPGSDFEGSICSGIKIVVVFSSWPPSERTAQCLGCQGQEQRRRRQTWGQPFSLDSLFSTAARRCLRVVVPNDWDQLVGTGGATLP